VTAEGTGIREPDAAGIRSLYVEPERPREQLDWPALQFHDVFKIYRSGPVETVALRGLELRVDRGELVAVLGPSGCGKSTMLALAAALDLPSAGEVRAGELSLGLLDEAALARYRAREVAVILQSGNLWPALSAHENVLLSLRLAGHEQPDEAADAALRFFGLGARARQRAGSLSGGEQQRVAVAAAAARRPPLVLADEPTGELDSGNESSVLEALREVRDRFEGTVLVVTHSARVAENADRVVEMRDGVAVSETMHARGAIGP
jgi:putative ABC transport system ATP-binding protein